LVLALRTVGGKVTAAGENEQVNMLNLMPSIMVVPTTSSSGVTISTNGLITFTSVTEVIVDSAFTSTYLNHEIVLDYQSDSTAASCTMVFRTPTDVTTATYDHSYLLGRNATAASVTTPGASSLPIVAFAVNKIASARLDISNAAIATETQGFVTGGAHADPAISSTANGIHTYYFTQRDDTAFTGVKFTFSNAATGTIRVRANL
jgi:hypothetical protein